eukprot:TRINITY_DN1276_c1_g4_i1.p4 TRINITY_DN1276_c1_g4~~TRINITY_DN1276_c1_g4_i1.p4  ORF type:complete len:138 (-),score=3.79 TRINITY_DN1276_c1_g4_i1:524-937(-)
MKRTPKSAKNSTSKNNLIKKTIGSYCTITQLPYADTYAVSNVKLCEKQSQQTIDKEIQQNQVMFFRQGYVPYRQEQPQRTQFDETTFQQLFVSGVYFKKYVTSFQQLLIAVIEIKENFLLVTTTKIYIYIIIYYIFL